MSISATSSIKKAMQEIGVLGVGKEPSANDLTDCRARANAMLDSWSNSSLMVPFRTQVSKTLDGSQSYTIGTGGDINTTRPTYIDSAYVQKDGDDYPLRVLRDRSDYDRITDKTITGEPYLIYYEPSLATGTVFVYYVGDSTYTLYLNTRGQLTQFPDNTTEIDVAPGYEAAIYLNLAIAIAPMYEVTVSAETVANAQEAKAGIKRLNRQIPVMQYDPAIPSRYRYNIETG